MSVPGRTFSVEQQGLARVFYALAIPLMLGLILYIGRGVLIPVVVAMFLSFIIVTVKNAISKIPVLGKLMPEFLGYILSFLLIALVLLALGQLVTSNAVQIIRSAPEYQEQMAQMLNRLIYWLSRIPAIDAWWQENTPTDEDFFTADGEVRRESYLALAGQFQRQALGLFSAFINEIGRAVRALAANLVTILLYTSFMLVERGNFLRKLSIVAEDQDERIDVYELTREIGNLVRQYISIKALTSFIVAALSWVIMLILGIDFAGFWALLIFALNFIPIIGSIIAVILPSVLALVQPDGGGVTLFLLTLGLLTAAEQLVGSVIEPRLLGQSLNLSPLVILLSLAIWGTLWGIAGMLLCVPITVGIMIVCSQFKDTRDVAVLLSDNGRIAPIRRLQVQPEKKPAA